MSEHARAGGRRRGAKPAPAIETQNLAGFAALETPTIDTEMWPIHTVIWLQPELKPVAPHSSGLHIERRYKVPAPDYLYPSVVPGCSLHPLRRTGEPLIPKFGPGIPDNDLSPLGWDPRAVCFAGSKELK